MSYLTGDRPTTDMREVFVCVRAPYRAMTRGAVTNVVAAAARKAGLGTVHAHRLRHSAATAMLGAGGSLNEIGQVLRHRHALTTTIYALKVDVDALRGRCPRLARIAGHRVSPLRQALADYLSIRRALGSKLDRAEKLLSQFVTGAGDPAGSAADGTIGTVVRLSAAEDQVRCCRIHVLGCAVSSGFADARAMVGIGLDDGSRLGGD